MLVVLKIQVSTAYARHHLHPPSHHPGCCAIGKCCHTTILEVKGAVYTTNFYHTVLTVTGTYTWIPYTLNIGDGDLPGGTYRATGSIRYPSEVKVSDHLDPKELSLRLPMGYTIKQFIEDVLPAFFLFFLVVDY